MISREVGSVVRGVGISKRATETEEAGESWREGGRGGVEGGSLGRGLALRRLGGAGEPGSLSTSCKVWGEAGGRGPKTEDKGGMTTLGIELAAPGVEAARVGDTVRAGGSDLGSAVEGFRDLDLTGREGRDRGGRAEPGNSHLNLRTAHKLHAARRVDVMEVIQATMCFAQ